MPICKDLQTQESKVAEVLYWMMGVPVHNPDILVDIESYSKVKYFVAYYHSSEKL